MIFGAVCLARTCFSKHLAIVKLLSAARGMRVQTPGPTMIQSSKRCTSLAAHDAARALV